MYDYFIYASCVNGTCPKIAEEAKYGTMSSCDVYCGNEFPGCDSCWLGESEECLDCTHYEENKDKQEK